MLVKFFYQATIKIRGNYNRNNIHLDCSYLKSVNYMKSHFYFYEYRLS